MEPLSWIAAGTALLNAVNGGKGGGGMMPANVLSGAPIYLNQDIDFSGFTVGTGSSKVTGAPNNKTTSQGAGVAPQGYEAAAGGLSLPMLIIGGATLAGLLWNR